MKIHQLALLFTVTNILVPSSTLAYPAEDKGHTYMLKAQRTETGEDLAVEVLRDHADGSATFWYIPATLRLVGAEKGTPEITFLGRIHQEMYHGLLQMHMTAALTTDGFNELRKKIAQ